MQFSICHLFAFSLNVQKFYGPFTQEELDFGSQKNKNRKAAGLDEIPRKYGRPDNSTTYCLTGLAKNYRGITLTSIALPY